MAIPVFMLMKPINKLIIILILIVATIIRLFGLNTLPSLNPDEAALGYNAYSLLKTGKDEHGASWPLHFKSFGDYKPGGYVYLAMPFIKSFGLNPLAIRLPNLILSVLTIFILFKTVSILTLNFRLSCLSALVLTLSPWHIHFSRGAWESNTALFFILLGVYLFFCLKKNLVSSYLFLSLTSFVASLYIYHSARLISPLLVLFLFISNWKLIISNLKKIIIVCTLAAVLTLPVAISFMNSGGTTRLGGVGLTADYGPIARAEELLNQHGNTQLTNRVTHNKRLLYVLSWAQKYTSHFDLNFLFINGDEVPRSKSPDMGQLYLIELPFLILGIVYLFKTKSLKPLSLITVTWLLVAPVPSSLTFQAPSALRALSMTIPLSIIIASGTYYFFDLTKKYFPHNLFLISIFYIYSVYYFINAYFIHAPKRFPFAWNTGFSEIVPYLESQKDKYQDIYFTDKYDQPYILYLFFAKYPPQKIQAQIELTPPDKFGFSTVPKIDNIIFHIPKQIPSDSLVIDSSDFQLTGKSFKIYTK